MASAADPPIRLMLVDDSIVARAIFQRMLDPRPEFAVVAVAGSAEEALDRLGAVTVDIVLLDVTMPGMDGLTALPAILDRARGARVLVVSSSCEAGGAAAVRALTLGAADTLAKPGAGAFGGRFADILADTLRRIGRASPQAAGGQAVSSAPVPPLSLRPAIAGPIDCIAIGASTGGPHALASLLRALPREIRAPILLTQHLPADFMPYFAAQLRDIAGRPAKVAADGDRLAPGAILIAPGDAHLGLTRGDDGAPRVALSHARAASGCLPSVDPMLDAAAALFGAGAVGVVLTGMGRDGAAAAPRFADTGGELLVQDLASSVIWGMPGVIALAGDAAAMLPPHAIAARIARRHADAIAAGR